MSQIKKINNIKKYIKAPLDLFGLISAFKLFRETKKKFSKKRYLTYENNTEFQLFEEIKEEFFQINFIHLLVLKILVTNYIKNIKI